MEAGDVLYMPRGFPHMAETGSNQPGATRPLPLSESLLFSYYAEGCVEGCVRDGASLSSARAGFTSYMVTIIEICSVKAAPAARPNRSIHMTVTLQVQDYTAEAGFDEGLLPFFRPHSCFVWRITVWKASGSDE